MKISLQNLHQSCKGTNDEFKKIKWPWNVKVKVKHIKNHENHLLSHNFETGSRRNFWLVGKHSLQNSAYVSYPQILTYDVTFLRHVTSNKMNNFEKKNSTNCQGQRSNWRSRSNKGQRSRSFNFFHYFVCYQCDIVEFMKHGNRLLQSSIFNRSFSKLIHIMFGPIRCNLQKNVTYVAMATKITIIKYREFLHISMCYISPVNEHIASKFIPVVHGNKWWILKSQMTLKCQGQGQTHQIPWKSPFEP